MKKKILHVSCGNLGYGGVSSVIFSIVENLYKEFDFDCIVFKKKGENEEKFLKYGKLHRINAYNSNGKRSIIELIFRPFVMFYGVYRICKKNKYDIIHAHNNFEEGICLFAAKCAGVPTRIAHSHNTPTPKKESILNKIRTRTNYSLINKYANKKIGCSEAACKAFFNSDDYKVIYNSVDLSKYKFNERIKSDDIVFIHVGRYTYQKNQEFVIRVFYEISKKIRNVKLKLVGYGEEEQKLKSLVDSLNINESVEFVPGNQVDVLKEYEKAQYMIFPSNFEGFGIALIEAQAKGIECFVSEAIQKEVDVGLLTFISLEKSPQEWANEILKHIENNRIIDFQKVLENLLKFDVKNIATEYEVLYRGVYK